MFGFPKVNIGLIGGEGYGKTVFLAGLLDLATSANGGCVELKCSRKAADKIKEIRERMRTGREIPSTDELCEYQYIVGPKGKAQWLVSFKDYAGEWIDPAKTDVDASNAVGNGIVKEGEEQPAIQYGRTSRYAKKFLKNIWGGIERLCHKCIPSSSRDAATRKLWKWLHGCDVVIFLLPVNMVHHKHLLQRCSKFLGVSRIRNISNQIQGKFDGSCVACLALSRGDLLNETVDSRLLLNDVPEFRDFYQQIKNSFGDETPCKIISAFGKHSQEDMFKPDPNERARGIDEMLAEIVPLSEKKRVTRVVDGYEALKGAWWKRCLCSPYFAVKAFMNLIHRIADSELRKANWKVFSASFKVLLESSIVTFAVLTSLIVSLSVRRGYFEITEIDSQMPERFSNAREIDVLEPRVVSVEPCSLWNWNKILLGRCRKELMAKFLARKSNYNASLLKTLETEHAKCKSEIADWENISADRRSHVLAHVMDVATNTLSRLTTDAVEQRQHAAEVVRQLEVERKSAAWNYDLDMAYGVWNRISDDVERANRAVDFLQRFSAEKYPNHKKLIERVREEKKRIEQARLDQLDKWLHQKRYTDDYGNKTDGWRTRVERSKERLKMIQQELNQIPSSSYKEELSGLLDAEKHRFDHLQLYGKFDEDNGELLTHKGDDAYAELVSQFLSEHPLTRYPDRRDVIDALMGVIESNEMLLVETCLRTIAATNLADYVELPWEIRIRRAEARMSQVSNCVMRLSRGSGFREALAETNRMDAALITNIRRDGEYYFAFDKAMRREPEAQISAINEILSKFEQGFPDVPQRYSASILRQHKEFLFQKFNQQLEGVLSVYADKLDLTWVVRREHARKRIAENQRYMRGCGIDRKTEIVRDEELIKICDANIAFDQELMLTQRPYVHTKDLFVAIYKFYEKFPEAQWRGTRAKDYDSVRALEQRTIERLKQALEASLKQYEGSKGLHQSLVECKSRIDLLTKYLENYLPSMDESSRAQAVMEYEKKRLFELQDLRVKEQRIDDLIKESEGIDYADKNIVAGFFDGATKVIGAIGDSCNDMIGSKYVKLRGICDKLDCELEKKMRAEIEPHKNKLNEILDDDERLQEENVRAEIYRSYLNSFCPAGKMYDRMSREFEGILKDRKKREDLRVVKRKLTDLNANLDEPNISAAVKCQLILDFWQNVGAYGKRDEFASLREEFALLDRRQDGFHFVGKFDEEKAEVVKFLKGKPDVNATSEMVEAFFHKGKKLSNDIETKWCRDARTRDLAHKLKRELDVSLASVENRVVMDEAFAKVKEAMRKFENSLSEDAYEGFRAACESYSTFALTKGMEKESGYNKIVTECAELNNRRKKLEELFANFQLYKTKNGLDPLMNYVRNDIAESQRDNHKNYLSRHSIYNFAIKCIQWDRLEKREKYLQVNLKGYHFKGRFYREKGVDFWAQMRIGGIEAFTIERNGLNANWLNSVDRLFSNREITHDKVCVGGLERYIEVQFSNTAFWGNENSDLIGKYFCEILADASVNHGTADVVFSDMGTGSSVTFTFSNLPYVR